MKTKILIALLTGVALSGGPIVAVVVEAQPKCDMDIMKQSIILDYHPGDDNDDVYHPPVFGGHHDDDHGHHNNVPEPATMVLIGLGLGGMGLCRKKR